MSHISSAQGMNAERTLLSSNDLSGTSKSRLVQLAVWINERNLPFLLISLGMVVMLVWAGGFKMTAPGAEGITPLVTHSPLISWQFRLFGPYVGSDLIGLTEETAALLFLVGYFKPKAGIVGGCITVVMFFTTSTMLITTPGTTIVVHGIHYMNNLGLFLFKDVIAFGASFYLITAYGKRAMAQEK